MPKGKACTALLEGLKASPTARTLVGVAFQLEEGDRIGP